MGARNIKNVLTIAGVDPSGGAGVLADVKVMSALGTFATGVIAALTAQNTRAVTGVMPVPAAFVKEQIDTLFADVRIDAVKIGMLGAQDVMAAVAQALRAHQAPKVVLDTVMVAKSGDRLMPDDAVAFFKEELLPLVTDETPLDDPNSIELELLSNLVADYSEEHFALGEPSLVDVLKLRMYEMGLNQKSLAKLIGVSPSRLSDYLSGKCEPTLKIAREISQKLNIDANIVLGV